MTLFTASTPNSKRSPGGADWWLRRGRDLTDPNPHGR
jgi:hypothetical protein